MYILLGQPLYAKSDAFDLDMGRNTLEGQDTKATDFLFYSKYFNSKRAITLTYLITKNTCLWLLWFNDCRPYNVGPVTHKLRCTFNGTVTYIDDSN